jgi:hypothetical protein
MRKSLHKPAYDPEFENRLRRRMIEGLLWFTFGLFVAAGIGLAVFG